MNYNIKSGALEVDPVEFLREVEKVWQARDGKAAAAGYTDDAVVYFGQDQSHRGAQLQQWPSRWFDFARDLQINKTYRAHQDNCIVGTWESQYTHPETGQVIKERGSELFYLRGTKVSEHHMWQHSWVEGETVEDKGFSTQ
jgi:hypothetical protein